MSNETTTSSNEVTLLRRLVPKRRMGTGIERAGEVVSQREGLWLSRNGHLFRAIEGSGVSACLAKTLPPPFGDNNRGSNCSYRVSGLPQLSVDKTVRLLYIHTAVIQYILSPEHEKKDWSKFGGRASKGACFLKKRTSPQYFNIELPRTSTLLEGHFFLTLPLLYTPPCTCTTWGRPCMCAVQCMGRPRINSSNTAKNRQDGGEAFGTSGEGWHSREVCI